VAGVLVLDIDDLDHAHDLGHAKQLVDLGDSGEASHLVDPAELEHRVKWDHCAHVNEKPASNVLHGDDL
jgi:hypothetical protein